MQYPLPRRLDELRRTVARLDMALQPIARRSIESSEANWMKGLGRARDPLEQAGVRREAEACLSELVRYYAAADEETRASIRELLAHYSSFAWAAALPLRAGDRASVREQLIHFSMLDQGSDARDAVLWLNELCARSGLDADELAVIRLEVARMSSTVDRHGYGSTALLLLADIAAGAS